MKYIYLILCFHWFFFSQSLTATDTKTNNKNFSEEPEPPTKKRKRHRDSQPVSKACDNCRIKHLKCSVKKPCETCTIKGIDCKGSEAAYKFHTYDMDSEHFTKVPGSSKNKRKRKRQEACDEPQSQHMEDCSLPAVAICSACQHQFSLEDPCSINQPALAANPAPTQYFVNPDSAAHDPLQAQWSQFQFNQGIAVQCTTNIGLSTSIHNFYDPYSNMHNFWPGSMQPANIPYPYYQFDSNPFQ